MRRQQTFLQREHYLSQKGYEFLPFRFLHFEDDKALLVNEVGEHILLRENELMSFSVKGLRLPKRFILI